MHEQPVSPLVTSRDQLLGEVGRLLVATLGLPSGALAVEPETRVLGAIPELDSMSVMTFLINLEEQYGIVIHDDEVDAAIFQTLGSLTEFLAAKLA